MNNFLEWESNFNQNLFNSKEKRHEKMMQLMFKTKFELMKHGDFLFTIISKYDGDDFERKKFIDHILNYYCQEKVISELVKQIETPE